MIEALSIANFKAFGGEPQEIPLKPLTIVFGANSSGKSSILHSLLFAHHAVQSGEMDVVYPDLGEGLVDLGGFRQLIHGAAKGAQHRLELRFRCGSVELAERMDERRNRINRMLDGPESTVWRSFLADVDHIDLMIRIGLTRDEHGHPAHGAKPQVEEYELNVGGEEAFTTFTSGKGVVRFSEVNVDLPLFRAIFESVIATESFRDGPVSDLGEVADEAMLNLLDKLELITNGFLPEKVDEVDGGTQEVRPMALNDAPHPEQVIQDYFPDFLSELVRGVGDMIRSDLASIQYLAPLRSYPPRHIGFAEGDAFNNKAGGGKAWLQIADNREVREKVNHWLSNPEKLRTPYTIKLRKFYSNSRVMEWAQKLAQSSAITSMSMLMDDLFDGDEEIRDSLIEAHQQGRKALAESDAFIPAENMEKENDILKISKSIHAFLESSLKRDELAKAFYASDDGKQETVADELTKLESDGTVSVILTDNRTDTEVSHRDVGIGISQVLPVLTMAYGSRNQILAIEQPEIHLHPALQAELADVFIESALGENRNRCLLETHSEHLILRILRRIREQSKKYNPTIKASDVAVLYVMPEKEGSKIVQIRIDKDGEFMDPWPGGFFPERLEELI